MEQENGFQEMDPPIKQPSSQGRPESKDTRRGEGFFFVAYIIGYKDCNDPTFPSKLLPFIKITSLDKCHKFEPKLVTFTKSHKFGPKLVTFRKVTSLNL